MRDPATGRGSGVARVGPGRSQGDLRGGTQSQGVTQGPKLGWKRLGHVPGSPADGSPGRPARASSRPTGASRRSRPSPRPRPLRAASPLLTLDPSANKGAFSTAPKFAVICHGSNGNYFTEVSSTDHVTLVSCMQHYDPIFVYTAKRSSRSR